jgi:hypothetical protein
MENYGFDALVETSPEGFPVIVVRCACEFVCESPMTTICEISIGELFDLAA